MTAELKGFSSYMVFGIANTFIHWLVAAVLCVGLDYRQSVGNLIGFSVAGSFSYCVNAVYTFSVRMKWQRYLLFMAVMGMLSLGLGHLADAFNGPLHFTLVISSLASLGLGYCYSRYIVFRSWS